MKIKNIFLLFLAFVFLTTPAFSAPPMYGGPGDQSNVAITGGTINGATIGATTPAAGAFTTLKATTGAAAGLILQSDASGNLTYTAPAAAANAGLSSMVNPKQMAQGVNMTYAASGSRGITVADNDNIDFGTGNFTLVWRGSLPDWTPSVETLLINKYHASGGPQLAVTTGGLLQLYLGPSFRQSASPGFVDGTVHTICAVVTSATGVIVWYVDGLLFETETGIGALPSQSNAIDLHIGGASSVRYASTTQFAATFNRALTAAEVLDLYRNGIPTKWRKASQTALTSGTLIPGQEYIIDTFVAGDDFSNIATVVSGTINTTGCIFVATGTTPTTWTNSSSLRATGGTLILEPEGIQPAPGQWLDSSSNKLHAWQPASGSSITRYKKTFEIRGINTWAGTHEAQSITMLTDASRAMLPVDCYITDIIGVITGATIEDIIIGDGSDTDRWVTITTGLAAGTVAFTPANRISDGTNYEMVVDPDANFTGTIEWTIRGIIIE